MKKNSLKVVYVVSIIVLMMIYVSCNEDEPGSDTQNGMILYMPSPDNCDAYVIRTDDNYWYKPSNLSSDLEVDSLYVSFTFDLTDKTHHCGFGGPISVVNLTSIEKR
ncbi:hypothetical protein FNH22_05990 [Fulvivirga sp. M361]|uniref:hypothetical protein n=1 Tax=Fulvivirga sp. M361 TaxID=2594266 RepID=UPI001179F4FF|nr:hypothetical protein [Fulvivirga sp. M361]TRX60597.1 hypothetical protein FNH22_05990 [Fulvivirga sp. M361]